MLKIILVAFFSFAIGYFLRGFIEKNNALKKYRRN